MLPGFRTAAAVERGVERNILLRTWGGIGDQICAEPTLRYALRSFRDCEVSLASERPELFSHLSFKRVYHIPEEKPDYERYLVLDTITPMDDSNLVWQFMSHMLVNCVDFPSLCALRCQIPVADREVFLPVPRQRHLALNDFTNGVCVHPGRHWQSKTFPADWWNGVLSGLLRAGKSPVIVGGKTDDNRGTVDVDTTGCVDLRDKLSLTESIWLLQRSRVLLTNDSAPLHMAASRGFEHAPAWIGYVATCKHPDMITHWRFGRWGRRMRNLGLGGIWDVVDYCPNRAQELSAERVPEETLLSWLPDPRAVSDWAIERLG